MDDRYAELPGRAMELVGKRDRVDSSRAWARTVRPIEMASVHVDRDDRRHLRVEIVIEFVGYAPTLPPQVCVCLGQHRASRLMKPTLSRWDRRTASTRRRRRQD